MIQRTQVFLKQLVLMIDGIAVTLAFLLTYRLRQGVSFYFFDSTLVHDPILESLTNFNSYLWLIIFILPIWLGAVDVMGGYRELRVKSFRQTSWVLLRASALGLLLFGSIVFVLKLHYVSRSFMVLFFLLSFSFLSLERAFLIECWHYMSRRDYFHRRLLLVGTGPRAKKIIRSIQAHRTDWGVRLIGLVDGDPKLVGRSAGGVKILGTLDDLPAIFQRQVVDEVIFAVPRSWMNRIEKSIVYCESVGVRASIAADLFNVNFAKAHPGDLDGTPLISFDTTPVDEWRLAIKRSVDLLVSAFGLLVLLPFFPLIAFLIKATSPGPVFFKQVRCGVNGRRFTLYKFRSMVLDAEERLGELKHLNEMNGPVFKSAKDPRLTPIGRWLRKTSIDELPQLWNVLKGEMSLVGPRPPIPQEVVRYEPWQIRRLSMRPGITGFWQVNGRNHIKDFNEWARLDLRYIDEWSLKLDFKILLKTVPVALVGRGAK